MKLSQYFLITITIVLVGSNAFENHLLSKKKSAPMRRHVRFFFGDPTNVEIDQRSPNQKIKNTLKYTIDSILNQTGN